MTKAFYSRKEIEALGPMKSAGKNWEATCPKCGKRNLRISKEKGVYHCFTAGCGFDGILTEYMEHKPKEAWEVDVRPSSRVHGSAGSPTNGSRVQTTRSKAQSPNEVPMIPSDYKPLTEKTINALTPITDEVRKYLQEQGLSEETAAQMGVMAARHRCYGSDDKTGRECNCIVYVNSIGGRAVNAKYRAVDAKLFSQDSPTTPCPPYNIDCLNPLAVEEEVVERLVIVEGEKDALTVRQAGYRYVISIANGAATDVAKGFEAFEEWLEPVRDVVICGDRDLPGRTLEKHLTDYFGARALTVTMPGDCKDISEVMQQFGWDAVREVIDGAKPIFTQDIVTVEEITAETLDVLHGHYDKGYDLGYGKLTDGVLHLTDRGGLIVVTGKPNAGKTDFLNCMMAHLVAKCAKTVCFCSFEVPDKAAHTAKMVRLILGKQRLEDYSSEDLMPILRYLDAHVTHLDMVEYDPTPANILLLADVVKRRGPMHFLVVDPYLFLDLRQTAKESLTQSVKRMLTTFQTWGRKNRVWVIIVAHPRKPGSGTGGDEGTSMYEIADSANWANLGDFIFSISRKDANDQGLKTNDPAVDYTKLEMLNVHDQDMCKTGSVLYVRQKCGRYDERPDVETIEAEARGHVQPRDTEPWITQM